MRLSEFNENNLSENEIEHIVFSNTEDSMISTEFGIVFGIKMILIFVICLVIK